MAHGIPFHCQLLSVTAGHWTLAKYVYVGLDVQGKWKRCATEIWRPEAHAFSKDRDAETQVREAEKHFPPLTAINYGAGSGGESRQCVLCWGKELSESGHYRNPLLNWQDPGFNKRKHFPSVLTGKKERKRIAQLWHIKTYWGCTRASVVNTSGNIFALCWHTFVVFC